MAEEPVIVEKKPLVADVEPGDYYWCACGRSAKQPFCDGAHKGTGLAPLKVTVTDAGKVPWCMCKHTKTPPYCDGAHTKLP